MEEKNYYQITLLGENGIGRRNLMRKFIGKNKQIINLHTEMCYTEQLTRYGTLDLKYLVQDRNTQLKNIQSKTYLDDTHIHLACFQLNNRKSFDTLREIRRKLFRMNFDTELKDRMRQNLIIVGIKNESPDYTNFLNRPSSVDSLSSDNNTSEAFSDTSSLASTNYETAHESLSVSSDAETCRSETTLQEETSIVDKETKISIRQAEEERNKITKQDIKTLKRKWKSVYYEVNLDDNDDAATKKLYGDIIGRLLYLTKSPFAQLFSSISCSSCTAYPELK